MKGNSRNVGLRVGDVAFFCEEGCAGQGIWEVGVEWLACVYILFPLQ